jgi:tyrosyl-tRNA synthetase
MGRELQKAHGQKPQTIITMPIIEGLDGVKKMSKTLNNYIAIADAPEEMFGKLMSISDELMWRYLELLSFRSMQEIEQWRHEVDEGANPRDIKIELAMEIVARFHGNNAAKLAHQAFIERFRQGAIPKDIPTMTLQSDNGELPIANILKMANLVDSTSAGIRMIKQGAVRIDGERIENKDLIINAGEEHIYQVGKRRFAKVVIEHN